MTILGFTGALFHVLNHSVFKGLLFYGAGSVYQGAHTLVIDRLGGLIKRMGATSLFFLIGAVAICGLPPLNGFMSELIVYFGALKGFALDNTLSILASAAAVVTLACVGALATLCFTKLFGVAFLGSPRSAQAANATEAPRLMLVPMAFLALLCVALGLFPRPIVSALSVVSASLAGPLGQTAAARPDALILPFLRTLRTASLLLAGMLGFAGILLVVRTLLLRRHPVSIAETWGCGYEAVTPRMQYTGRSYARTFLGVVSPLFREDDRPAGVRGLFPVRAESRGRSQEVIDFYVAKPAGRFLRAAQKRLTWIQNGNLQQYILYGLIFLIIALVWVLGFAK